MTDQPDLAAPARARASQRAARDSTFLKADLRRGDGRVLVGVRVRNLSAGGMMAETAEQFDDGEALQVVLRTVGAVAARVAWAADQRVGIAFDRPICPEDVRRAPARSPGTTMQLFKPTETQSRRPGLKTG